MPESDKIIETIRRVEALVHSTNEFEAAVAAGKFQELLFKHNLTVAEYNRQRESNDVGDYIHERTTIADGGWDWRGSLLSAIASNNFCKVIGHTGAGEHSIIGRRHNIEVVLFMYEYLHRELVRFAPLMWERQKALDMLHELEGEYVPKRTSAKFRESYLTGAVSVINERLHAKQQELATANEESTALVVVTGKELDEAVKRFFPNLRYARSRRRSYDNAALRAGREIGARIGLVTQPRSDFAPNGGRRLGA